MQVLLVGGSGFLGRRTARLLSESGFTVLNLDRSEPPQVTRSERVVRCNLGVREEVRRAASCVDGVDAIVWLAADISQVHYVDAEVAHKDLRLMVEAPMEFIGSLHSHPQIFLYISSIQVYGKPHGLPVSEAHPTDPFTAYGIGKLSGEKFVGILCRQSGITFTALRPAFIYGPGQHKANVIPKFIETVRNGQAPVINGDGQEIRDDVHVDDVAKGIKCALERRIDGAFNISSGRPHTLLDVAKTICEVSGTGVTPRCVNTRSTWVDRWYCIDQARRHLGFEPEISLRRGITDLWSGVGS